MVAPGRPQKITEVEGESRGKKNFHAERKNPFRISPTPNTLKICLIIPNHWQPQDERSILEAVVLGIRRPVVTSGE
jgi:hypothetical protein